MDFWAITFISLVAGLILVIGGGLVIHMGSLVKAAYELKVEIRSDMEGGLRKIEEEADKKTRWIKRDLSEEIEKIRAAITVDNARRFAEMEESLGKKLQDLDTARRADLAEVTKQMDSLRKDLNVLDQRTRVLIREQQRVSKAASENGSTTPSEAAVLLAAAAAASATEPSLGMSGGPILAPSAILPALDVPPLSAAALPSV